MNKINVKVIKTDKFKSVTGMLCFKMPIKKEMMAKRSLMRRLLIFSCKKYPTNKALNINCLENYGAYYSAGMIREGNYIINNFVFKSLEDKYTKEGNLKNVIDTFCEIIFNPNVKDNAFDKEAYDLIYQELKAEVESEIERPRTYAISKLNGTLDKDSPVAYKVTIDDLLKVTSEQVYEEYLNMLNNSEVDLIIAGNITDVPDELKPAIKRLKQNKYDEELIINNDEIEEGFKAETEVYDGEQSILTLGVKLDELSDFERTYVVPIFSGILGGGASSRLFNVIREEHSLAYFCFSRYEKDDSLMYIVSGIDGKNYEQALKLIKEVFNTMDKVSDEEVEKVRNNIISVLKESEDSLGNYPVNYYVNKLYNEPDNKAKIKFIKQVTKADVERVFSKVHLTNSYFLKGGVADGKDKN
ncbi:MAG: insulinase family protein [Bacilli bacterium]|nr:insulinase family protein [Bacilli bacterium]